MVTTRTSTEMEERVDGLEQQMAEFRAEQGRLMEAMMKRFDDLVVQQVKQQSTVEDHDSHIKDPGGGQRREVTPNKGDYNRRLEGPPFDGSDASGWLVRIDRFFRISGIPVSKKLEYVVLAFHGEALTWFEWWEAQSSFHTWLRFKQDLLCCFEPGAASNPLALLLKVCQVGLVMDYRCEFELAARSHRNLGGETLMCMFHEGLKPTISSEMAVTKFENLQAMMDWAMVLEARNLAWREEGR